MVDEQCTPTRVLWLYAGCVSVITNASVERLNLKEGSEVTAIIKVTEVLLAG